MISRIIDFFNQNLKVENDSNTAHKLNLASAALLIEMIRMDRKVEQAELDTVKAILKNEFKLSDTETHELFEMAEEAAANAVDYYRFAKLINEKYDNTAKINLIENLWKIAYADGELNKYEEHYLRKIAEILHVPHKEFIRAKHRIAEQV